MGLLNPHKILYLHQSAVTAVLGMSLDLLKAGEMLLSFLNLSAYDIVDHIMLGWLEISSGFVGVIPAQLQSYQSKVSATQIRVTLFLHLKLHERHARLLSPIECQQNVGDVALSQLACIQTFFLLPQVASMSHICSYKNHLQQKKIQPPFAMLLPTLQRF